MNERGSAGTVATYRILPTKPSGRRSILPLSEGGFVGFVLGTYVSQGITQIFDDYAQELYSIAFAPRVNGACALCGRRFLTISGYDLSLWTLKDGLKLAKKFALPAYLHAIVRVHDDIVAVTDSDGTLSVWDITAGSAIRSIPYAHKGAINTITILPNQNLATGGADNQVKIWDSKDFRQLATIDVKEPVLYLKALSTGDLLVKTPEQVLMIKKSEDVILLPKELADGAKRVLEITKDDLFCGVLDDDFLIYNLPTEEHRKVFWKSKSGWLVDMEKLKTGNIILSDSRSNLILLSFNAQKWEKMYKWLFLGKSDSNSELFSLPQEFVYHFISTTLLDLRLHNMIE